MVKLSIQAILKGELLQVHVFKCRLDTANIHNEIFSILTSMDTIFRIQMDGNTMRVEIDDSPNTYTINHENRILLVQSQPL